MLFRSPHLQTSGVVEDQQVGSLGWQRGENIWGGQREKSLLELSWSQGRKGDRGGSLEDRRGEHRRHPGGESSACDGENGAESALGNGLNDRRRDKGRNFRVKRLGWVKGQEVGEEAGGVGRSHRGTRDRINRILGSDPGGEDVQT